MRRWIRPLVLLLALFCLLGVTFRSDVKSDTLKLYFFDVGQGDAILLRTREGDILIDAGSEQSEQLLCLRLEQIGVTQLKLAIFTHFDEDHIGGADAVLRSFPAKTVWVSHAHPEGEAAKRMLLAADECGAEICRVYSGAKFELGELFLMAVLPFTKTPDEGNEGSVAVRMQYGDVSALFMGDAGEKQEAVLVERYGPSQLDVDLCKLGHHGSKTASSLAFLECTSPQYAVISCDAVNSYGHPSGEVLARLREIRATICCTAWQGEIVFESDGKRLFYKFSG